MEGKPSVFLTGATGLIASYLARVYLKKGHIVYVLARDKIKPAQERVLEILKFWGGDIPKPVLNNLKVIKGDILYPDFGIKSKTELDEIISDVEVIFHSAALARLRVPVEEIRPINVGGAKNALDLALKCRRLKKFNHISTAFVVGKKKNTDFSEDMLDIGQGFNNTYEQTKYEAEVLTKDYAKKGLNISIFRPSMVMGDSISGRTNDFRLFYEPLHIFSLGIYKEFPGDINCFQNFINIDSVAEAISLLGMEEEAGTYHIVSPKESTLGFFIDTAEEYFGYKMPKFIPAGEFSLDKLSPVLRTLAEPYIPYFNYNTRFASEKTQAALKKYGFEYPKIDKENLLRIFAYCAKKGFIKQFFP